MSVSTALTITGIISTVLFGVLGIWLIAKHKYPGQITFVRESCIGLFDSIVKNMPELTVQYQGKPVGQNLVLLKGALLNTGSKDICDSMVEKNISVSLPEGFKWLTARIISTSPKVQAAMKHSSQVVTFETGLFRCKEYLRFEMLAEVPIKAGKEDTPAQDKLNRAINITHRIADTRGIKTRELIAYNKQQLLDIIIMGIFLAAFFTGLVYYIYSDFSAKNRTVAEIETAISSIREDPNILLDTGVATSNERLRYIAKYYDANNVRSFISKHYSDHGNIVRYTNIKIAFLALITFLLIIASMLLFCCIWKYIYGKKLCNLLPDQD